MQPCEAFPAPVAQIDAAIAAGKPVILQVDWNKQAGIQTHFVLVKEKKGDDYVLYDPYKYGGDGPDKEVLLTKRYKYNGASLETEISAVLWFDGNIPPSPPKPPKKVTPPADSMTLYVIEDDLALRADPSVGGYLWKRMTAGSELNSLEDAATTKAKLGQQGQWVQVQDSTGQQGYTAAWYVSDNKDPQPASPPAAPNLLRHLQHHQRLPPLLLLQHLRRRSPFLPEPWNLCPRKKWPFAPSPSLPITH